MQKIDKPYEKNFSPMTIYKKDIIAIYQLFKDNNLNVVLEIDDNRLDSIDEIETLDIKPSEVNYIVRVDSQNKLIHLSLNESYAQYWVHTDKLNNHIGLGEKISLILAPRLLKKRRRFWFDRVVIIILILTAIISILKSKTDFTILIPMFTSGVAVGAVLGMISGFRNRKRFRGDTPHCIIYLKNKEEMPSFIDKHKDKIIISIITAVVTAVITGIVTTSINKLMNQPSASASQPAAQPTSQPSKP